MRIRLFENHGAVETLHFSEIGLGKYMGLKIDDHVSRRSQQ